MLQKALQLAYSSLKFFYTSIHVLSNVPIQVTIPGPLLQYTRNQKEIQLLAGSVLDVIKELDKKFPGMKDRICDEQEKVREYVNIFVNGEDFRHLKGEQTKLKDGDEMMILPSIAGGAI